MTKPSPHKQTFKAPRRMFGIVFAAALILAPLAFASTRIFPADSYQVVITGVADPLISVDGTTVQIAAGALLFSATGTTMTRSALTTDTTVRIQFDANCRVKRLWILTDEETIPHSWWESVFSGSFTPPCTPS